jgi:uncharacterized protein YkwD
MWRALLAAFIVLVAGGATTAPSAQPRLSAHPPVSQNRKASGAARVTATGELEDQVVAALNAQRSHYGLAALRVNRQLASTARNHSLSMAEHGYFDHDAFDGSPFWRRIRTAYPALPGRVWRAGENLAWASPDMSAAQAIELWMNSPAHRKNMLAPSWREIGAGGVHAIGAPGVYEGLDVTIMTVDFGAR